MQRSPYIVAYDIAAPDRLKRALRAVRAYSLGGQKSVFECMMSPVERDELAATLQEVVDPDHDRVFLLRLDPRSGIITLGRAVPPVYGGWFYIG